MSGIIGWFKRNAKANPKPQPSHFDPERDMGDLTVSSTSAGAS